MVEVVKKPDQKEVTTILGKDVHKIIEKYSDAKKYKLYRDEWYKNEVCKECVMSTSNIDDSV